MYEQPDWGKVHRELARVGVTLRILHGEYVDECRQSDRPRVMTIFIHGLSLFGVGKPSR